MKKRILALALAGTTAFSVFGGLNVFAATKTWDDFGDAYTDGSAYTQKATNDALQLSDRDVIYWNDLKKIAFDFDDRTDAGYYVGDWKVRDADKVQDFEDAVKAALSKKEKDYEANGWAVAWDIADKLDKAYYVTDDHKVRLKSATLADDDFYSAWKTLRENYDEVKEFMDGTTASIALVDAEYDLVQFDSYEAEDLFADIYSAYSASKWPAGYTLSTIEYLNAEYERILGEIDPADHSDLIDRYEHLHEAVTALTESDYAARPWSDIQNYLDKAEIEAEDEEWAKAVGLLESALKVTPEKGDYKELEATLMSMYTDNNGRTFARYINEKYTGNNTIYKAADYTIKKGVYTDEWEALFDEPIWYYNPLDAVDVDNASGFEKEEFCDGVYGYAYELYYKATHGTKVAQTRLDTANDMLIEALEALDPSSTSTEWALVKLEKAVALGESLVDTDFNTTSVKWKTFQTNLEKAQAALAKDGIGKLEIKKVTDALDSSIKNLASIAKNPSYTLKKEYLATLKEAKEALKAIEDQNATQYKTLLAAINAAEEGSMGTWLDVDEEVSYKELPSDFEEAIANLEAAIAGYVHPQGWYQDEAGTWFYGVGTENYTGWLEINGRNYFLKDDGSMAASTWVKTDKGYWYYLNESGIMLHDGWGKVNGSWYYFKNFGAMAEGWLKLGNTWYYLQPGSGKMVTGWNLINGKYYYFDASGAMLANTTTPDGYKVDASGAWVK